MNIELFPAGIAEALNQATAIAFQRERAAEAVDDAKRTGPRNPAHKTHVIDQLKVGASRPSADGAVTEIEWDSPFWAFVEYGSANFPPARPLTRGAQNAGLKVIERG